MSKILRKFEDKLLQLHIELHPSFMRFLEVCLLTLL